MSEDERQCRICLAGAEETSLGRLIKPCLCRGSISHVHIKCLQTWRNSSGNSNRFYFCPQCKYKYRFARTFAVGIATNPVVVGTLSAFSFTVLVLLSSFVTTTFMSWFEEPSDSSDHYNRTSFFISPFFVSPLEVMRDIIRAALRILQDEGGETFGHGASPRSGPADPHFAPGPNSEPGIIKSLVRRFFLGLPVVGAGSAVQMLLSLPLTPLHFLARFRSSSRRRDSSSQDIASLIIIGLILLGAVRALIKVYGFMESLTKRLLLRAEDAILEV